MKHVEFLKPTTTEKGIELRIRVALATAGCIVWKHTVEACHACGVKPTKRTGLGEGATDLLALDKQTKRTIYIEVKRPGYSPSDIRPAQRERIAVLRRFGFIAGVASSEEQALDLLAEARA